MSPRFAAFVGWRGSNGAGLEMRGSRTVRPFYHPLCSMTTRRGYQGSGSLIMLRVASTLLEHSRIVLGQRLLLASPVTLAAGRRRLCCLRVTHPQSWSSSRPFARCAQRVDKNQANKKTRSASYDRWWYENVRSARFSARSTCSAFLSRSDGQIGRRMHGVQRSHRSWPRHHAPYRPLPSAQWTFVHFRHQARHARRLFARAAPYTESQTNMLAFKPHRMTGDANGVGSEHVSLAIPAFPWFQNAGPLHPRPNRSSWIYKLRGPAGSDNELLLYWLHTQKTMSHWAGRNTDASRHSLSRSVSTTSFVPLPAETSKNRYRANAPISESL